MGSTATKARLITEHAPMLPSVNAFSHGAKWPQINDFQTFRLMCLKWTSIRSMVTMKGAPVLDSMHNLSYYVGRSVEGLLVVFDGGVAGGRDGVALIAWAVGLWASTRREADHLAP